MAELVHICNAGTPALAEGKQVTTSKDLDKWKGRDVMAWFVFAHLTWDGHKLSQNHGFDVAQRIRMEFGSMAPIIFYSPIEKKYFTQLNDVKYKLLNGCGSAFLGIPSTAKALEKLLASTDPISKTTLLDVVTMLCNVRGWVVDRVNHDLKPENPSGPVFDEVGELLSNEQKAQVRFQHYQSKFAEVDNGRDAERYMELRKAFIQACDALLPKEQRSPGTSSQRIRPYKHRILLLEDDPVFRESAKASLSEEFSVHAVATSSEAIELLDKDLGDIMAVICDWRLYQYREGIKTDQWQCPQGYSVLEHAAKSGVPRGMLALTSQDDRLVHSMRNMANRRYWLFKKEHLTTSGQWQVMLDVIHQGCQEAWIGRADEVIGGQKGWVHPGEYDRSKEEAYLEIWNSLEREEFYADVTTLADEAWAHWVKTKKNYLVGSIPELEYSGKVNDRSDMRKFFALRRLYYALWFSELPSYELKGSALADHRDRVEKIIWNLPRRSQKRFHLCINFKEVKASRMFTEELVWLKRHRVLPENFG